MGSQGLVADAGLGQGTGLQRGALESRRDRLIAKCKMQSPDRLEHGEEMRHFMIRPT